MYKNIKKFEVHTIIEKAVFSNKQDRLTEKVEQFLNRKSNGRCEVINVSFTYYEASELVAFMTICK